LQNRINIIGRTKEKNELNHYIDSMRGGNGGMVLVSGEAGVGKTTLVEEVLLYSGADVLISRANEEGNAPYSMISSAFRSCMRQHGNDKINCGSLSKYLSLILPELGIPPKDVDAETLKEAITSTFINLATENPIVVFLDDIHWADNATIEFLSFISSCIRKQSLLIVASYRSDEVTRKHKVTRLKSDLRRKQILNEIIINPLDWDETHSFISKLLNKTPSSDLTNLLFTRTQGIPFYVEELTGALIDNGNIDRGDEEANLLNNDDVPIPESIKDTILQHLNYLSPEAQKHIEVAAVAGIEFDLNMLIELAGNETGLEELFEKKLIREKGENTAEFRHTLIREAVKGEVMWTRRKNLHKQIASYLEEKSCLPEIVAEHWLAANELEKARSFLIDSVEQSCSLYAYQDAYEYANKALEIWPDKIDEVGRIEMLKRLSQCSKLSGKLNDAIRALKEIIETPYISQKHGQLGELYRSLATLQGLKGAWELSVDSRNQSAEEFEKAGLLVDAASEYLAAAGRYVGMIQTNKALDAVNNAIELAKKAKRIDIESMAIGLSGNILSMRGNFEKGRVVVQEALSLALKNNLTDAASTIYRRLASTLEYASDYLSARDAYYNAYNFCVTEGKEVSAQVCLSCMSYTLFQTGDWKKSLEFCRDVITDKNTPENSIPIGHGMMGLIFAFRGEIKKALKSLKEALKLTRKLEIKAGELISLWGFAVVYHNELDSSSAEETYRTVLSLWKKTQDRHDVIPVLMWASKFFAENNFEKETTQCAEALASIASSTGNPEAMAALAYSLGENALMNNNIDEAINQFSQALSHLDKFEIPLEKLFIEIRLGTVLRMKSLDKNAIQHFNNALSISKKLGTRPFSSIIDEELESLGVSSKESRKEDSDERKRKSGLTKRQMEILELLSQGLTNKEIAEKLFLSPRTVDMHVSHVLERLNCRSRMEAMNKAKEIGLL
jgi:predicted ATPase/DNA-binding CsgD family transcriptional regulator